MKTNRLLATALMAAVLVSCSQDEVLKFSNDAPVVFTGSMEETTSRVLLEQDYMMSWEMGDELTIFPQYDINNLYKVIAVDNGLATFEYVDYVDKADYEPIANTYAVYPYYESNKLEGEVISTEVPSEINYIDMENSIKYALMSSKSNGSHLNFTNAQGILRLKLNAVTPFKYGAIQSITLTSTNNLLSGKAKIDYAESNTPEAKIVEGDKSLTINLAQELQKDLPSAKSDKWETYYIPVVPTQFANEDLTLTIVGRNSETFNRPVRLAFGIERKKIYTLYVTLDEQPSYSGELEGAVDNMWDGETITTPEITTDENGQEYFSVKHASDLAGIAAMVNGTMSRTATTGMNIKLENDINLQGHNWTPIGNWDNAFEGTFDGQGYTISNLSINAPAGESIGLFGVAANATIKDITVKNANIIGKEMAAAIVGYVGENSIVSNCHVSGNVNVVADTHAAGITAYSNCAIENCSVIANGTGTIESKTQNVAGGICGWLLNGNSITNCQAKNLEITGWANVGSIVGVVCYDNEITDCKAENVSLEKTRLDGAPSIGSISGGWSHYSGKTILVKNVELKNITMNGTYAAYDFEDKALFGSEYYGKTTSIIVKENITEVNIINNLVEAVFAKNLIELQSLIDNVNVTKINLTANIEGTAVMKSNKTIIGNGFELGSVNLNGADNVTLKNITFDAANAVTGYDGKGNAVQPANIVTGDKNNNPGNGTNNLIIEGCTFTGTFANGGVTIAFTDQGRGSGQSGNITIKDCTFSTKGAYCHIYTYYSGKEKFIIENNNFVSTTLDKPIYLGRYQSSVPVVVKENKFASVSSFEDATYIQAHSAAYTVSFDASDNTFAQ